MIIFPYLSSNPCYYIRYNRLRNWAWGYQYWAQKFCDFSLLHFCKLEGWVGKFHVYAAKNVSTIKIFDTMCLHNNIHWRGKSIIDIFIFKWKYKIILCNLSQYYTLTKLIINLNLSQFKLFNLTVYLERYINLILT